MAPWNLASLDQVWSKISALQISPVAILVSKNMTPTSFLIRINFGYLVILLNAIWALLSGHTINKSLTHGSESSCKINIKFPVINVLISPFPQLTIRILTMSTAKYIITLKNLVWNKNTSPFHYYLSCGLKSYLLLHKSKPPIASTKIVFYCDVSPRYFIFF